MGGKQAAATTFDAAKVAGNVWTRLVHLVTSPQVLFGRLGVALLVVLIALVLYLVTRRLLGRLKQRLEAAGNGSKAAARRAHRSSMVVGLIGDIIRWAIMLIAGFWILAILGVNLLPVLTGAGIVGIAIGMGAQSLVKDYVSGLFLLLDGQFTVGEYVNINNNFGLVEGLNLRTTVLRDLDNQLHYLPNGSIAAITVYEEHHVDYLLDVQITEADKQESAVREIAAILEDMKQEFHGYLISSGTPTAHPTPYGVVSIKTTVWVFPSQDWLAQEEIPARVQRRLADLTIAVPEGSKPRVYLDLGRMPRPAPEG